MMFKYIISDGIETIQKSQMVITVYNKLLFPVPKRLNNFN